MLFNLLLREFKLKLFCTRFCESCFNGQLLSPWEKVAMWHLEGNVCDAEARLKDLLNMEWLRIQIQDGKADKVRKQ